MKYIDAEKLIAKIGRRKDEWQALISKNNAVNPTAIKEVICEDLNILDIITSLQQEQPMPDSTKLIGLWYEDKEMLKEKDFRNDPWRLAYNAFLCGFGRGIAVKKQEQPEAVLEKEIDRVFFQKDCGSDRLYYKEIAKIAHHFYELGLKARKESIKDCNGLDEAAMNYIAPIENEDGLKVINFSGRDIKDAFIEGAEWQKAKMMKGAVEGKVRNIIIHENGDEVHYSITYPKGKNQYSINDKVKIIIL